MGTINGRDLHGVRRPRAIVLGVEHPRAIAVIRSLGRAGIGVDAVDHERTARGFSSRYVQKKFLIGADKDQALELLESLGRDVGGMLIPTNDHYVMLVAHNFERLSRFFIMTTPPWEVMDKLMDKPQCYGIAQDAGLKTPRFFTPRDVAEVNQIISGLDFGDHAYVLKTKLWDSGPADVRT